MNATIAYRVLQGVLDCGVTDFVVCPGMRNAPFIDLLRNEKRIAVYYWPEERSASFFALGLSRRKHRPVAVIVTSGTAVGELLPAVMEAYYSGVPLLLITTDRPRRFRGSGAPQAAEQVGIFGHYAKFCLDVHGDHLCDLSKWNQMLPAQINVCLEEPQGQPAYSGPPLNVRPIHLCERRFDQNQAAKIVNRFLSQADHLLVIVSTLPFHAKEAVVEFLLELNVPVYLEGISGLQDEPRLQPLRIRMTENLLGCAKNAGYSIDGVLRIGGVPTNRIWRDIENLKNQIKVCSVSEQSFSGLSWNRNVAHVKIASFLKQYQPVRRFDQSMFSEWLTNDQILFDELQKLFIEEPQAEPSLIHTFATLLPKKSHVYLGNSLPIREWDLAAHLQDSERMITASRGLNGIDGQVSAFLGLCQPDRNNWAVLGDLTALYDMIGFWALPFIEALNVSIAVVNNGGAKIFERFFPYPELLNKHELSFEPLAAMWKIPYQRWEHQPQPLLEGTRQFIEIVPDDAATKRFWDKLGRMMVESGSRAVR